MSHSRPAGESLMSDARRTVHGPAGVSTRTSARQRRSGSEPVIAPRSVSVPPASDRAKTAAPSPDPAQRMDARMPPGSWITAWRGSAGTGAG